MNRRITKVIKGKGRGKLLGYPTINLAIPSGFNEKEGIYASWVTVNGIKYKGALHFGPVPTFGEKEKSLEVFLIDAKENDLNNIKTIEVELVKKIRDVIAFTNIHDLSEQIGKDVQEAKKFLSKDL